METIKKFKNRKLYSTTTKGYVTLNYLLEKLRNSEDFQVLEHGTNVDITDKTLRQALVNTNLSKDVIREILNNG